MPLLLRRPLRNTAVAFWAFKNVRELPTAAEKRRQEQRSGCIKLLRVSEHFHLHVYCCLLTRTAMILAVVVHCEVRRFLKFHTLHSPRMRYKHVTTTGQNIRALKYFLCCISASIGWIFLNLHTWQSSRMRYKRYKWGYNRSIAKGTLLG